MLFLKRFFGFWYGFVVGDDWLIAVGVLLALGATSLLTHDRIDAWWLMPIAVVVLLAISLWRETRRLR